LQIGDPGAGAAEKKPMTWECVLRLVEDDTAALLCPPLIAGSLVRLSPHQQMFGY
jgi:hypothetical protein